MQDKNKEKTEKLAAFSHRLGVLAGRARLKQKQIAISLGVTPQRVGSWFQAKNYPGGDIELALAELLGTSVEWLIDGKETTENKDIISEQPQAPYGDGAMLEAQIRRKVEESIRAAGGDRVKLGWLLSQINEHTRPQAHWADEAARAKLEELKRRAKWEGGDSGPGQQSHQRRGA